MKYILIPILCITVMFCSCGRRLVIRESNIIARKTKVMDTENIAQEIDYESETTVIESKKIDDSDLTNINYNDSGLSVITVGTGTPQYNADKASASTMINYNGELIVVDCGEGSYANIMESGYDLKNMYGLFFTHMHLDHTADFMNFIITSLLNKQSHLDIVGPPSTSNLYEFIKSTFSDDVDYRLSNINKNKSTMNKTDVMKTGATVTEIKGENTFTIGDITVKTAEMTHTAYTLAYRFEADGKSIVISGDTDYDEDLINLAENCDILVIDGSSVMHSMNNQNDNTNNTKPHMNRDDLISIAKQANPKKLVITHYQSMRQSKINECISIIQQEYDGEVIFSEDMMQIY